MRLEERGAKYNGGLSSRYLAEEGKGHVLFVFCPGEKGIQFTCISHTYLIEKLCRYFY